MKFGKVTDIGPYSGPTVKISNFCKFKMAAAAILTAPTFKKFEFQKSKMADGRHFEKRYIAIFLQMFDHFR